MRKLISLVLACSIFLAFLLAGCSSDNKPVIAGNTAPADDLSLAADSSAAKTITGGVIFYPALDDGYKTCKNEKFDFWFDVPLEWKVVDRSEDGSAYHVLTGNNRIELKIYGVPMDGTQSDFYRKLAGSDGNISDFDFRDGWTGKKIDVSDNETYYARVNGESFIVFYINTSEDPEWRVQNEEAIGNIAVSIRVTRESFGKMEDELSSITPADLKLGNIEVGMTYEMLLDAIGQKPVDTVTEDYDGMKTKMLNFADDTQVYVVNNIVYTVNVVDPGYATPRGLRPGDSEERILELYGEPNNRDDNIWGYTINGYELLTIVTEDGVVTQIQIEQGVWDIEVF